MEKLERLLNLTAALLNTERPLSAEQLKRGVGGYPKAKASFRRTFERDKSDLRKMGIPLRTMPVPGVDPPVDGYRIFRSEYTGAEIQLAPDELAALHLAANFVRLNQGEAGLHKFGKAGEEFEPASVGKVPFDERLTTLISAAANRRAISFEYGDAKSRAKREVEPWRLSFARGHWYLSGWDKERLAERLFRLDRIQGELLDVGEATSPKQSTVDPSKLLSWELGEGEPIEVRVAVDADQISYLRYLIGQSSDNMEGEEAGIVRFKVRNREAFRSFVLTFLEHAEVLDPPEMRADIISWLEAQT